MLGKKWMLVKKILSKKFGKELDGQKKILVKKYFAKKFLGEMILWSKILFGKIKMFVKKMFVKKMFVKKFWVRKIYFWVEHKNMQWIRNFSVVKTQRNSTQLKATLLWLTLELDTVVTCSTPPHPTTPRTNFSATSRPARELTLIALGFDN